MTSLQWNPAGTRPSQDMDYLTRLRSRAGRPETEARMWRYNQSWFRALAAMILAGTALMPRVWALFKTMLTLMLLLCVNYEGGRKLRLARVTVQHTVVQPHHPCDDQQVGRVTNNFLPIRNRNTRGCSTCYVMKNPAATEVTVLWQVWILMISRSIFRKEAKQCPWTHSEQFIGR